MTYMHCVYFALGSLSFNTEKIASVKCFSTASKMCSMHPAKRHTVPKNVNIVNLIV
jgi:hypothetical protein